MPFKARRYKSRLAAVLRTDKRRLLALILLRGVLDASLKAGLAAQTFVVSSDKEALQDAALKGASGIQEPRDAGVNAAVWLAMRSLAGIQAFMILPSDLPLLSHLDLEAALALGERFAVVISPSNSFNGTNMLLFRRRGAPILSFDSNSFWNHLGSAASRGLSVSVYANPRILFDLDSPSDALRLLRMGTKTRAGRFLKGALKQ